MNNTLTLKAQNLIKSYNHRKVVNDVCLEISQGEIVGLLGPNGAGKTTTFHMIIGFIKPDAGKIYLGDKDISYLAVYERARLGLGYLAQEPSIFRKLTVQENLLAVLEFLPVPKEKYELIIDYYLTKFNIKHLAKSKGENLSGGERRRVELARALLTNPKFLLLDEPFTGIDPIVRAEIQDIIKSLKAENIGVLITDHNVRETLEITDRTYIMYDGKILISGSPQDIINNPVAQKHYLGERFRI
ncbi:MAG: LPS export ABC transporter ATP-binding protein [candidate division WOR-3 bacterium]|nr:LPS export ABC transporter ATP-binding protein [candidate division WOR-3 bacterium]MCX7757314.1 LPS export ABC transporter ATP-binding protein [candidate division WOR-3 bacterium]MDW7988434.1 LPS export ABC transporter ATP-binding protein [candidate division WOR-3 bacterium]